MRSTSHDVCTDFQSERAMPSVVGYGQTDASDADALRTIRLHRATAQTAVRALKMLINQGDPRVIPDLVRTSWQLA